MPVTSFQRGFEYVASLVRQRGHIDQVLNERPSDDIAADGGSRFGRERDVAENHADAREVGAPKLSRVPKRRSRRMQSEMKHRIEPLQQSAVKVQPFRVKLKALNEAAPCRIDAIRLRRPRRGSLLGREVPPSVRHMPPAIDTIRDILPKRVEVRRTGKDTPHAHNGDPFRLIRNRHEASEGGRGGSVAKPGRSETRSSTTGGIIVPADCALHSIDTVERYVCRQTSGLVTERLIQPGQPLKSVRADGRWQLVSWRKDDQPVETRRAGGPPAHISR